METHTIIKIILSVILSLFLLALIGRKTRENFEASSEVILGNVEENSEQFENQSGFSVNDSHNPDIINAPSIQNVKCSILTNNANKRTLAISKDLAEAKKQLQEHINKVKSKQQQRQVNIFDQGSDYYNTCKLLKYPALL